MQRYSDENQEKKSPNERFLFVIGIFFFLMYFLMGVIVILWKNFPIEMDTKYRIALGLVLIGYSFLRFYRFFNSKRN